MIRATAILCALLSFGTGPIPAHSQDPAADRADVASINLPFAATRIAMSADGGRAAVWDNPRTTTDMQSLAVIDLRLRRLVAQAILQTPLLDVVVGNDILTLDSRSITRLSVDRLVPQATFEYRGGSEQYAVTTDQPAQLMLVANRRLSLGWLRLALPELTLIEHSDHGMNMKKGWYDGRCGFGWLSEGVLWDDSMSKPLLLAWPYEFQRAPFNQATRKLRDIRPSSGTWHPFPNEVIRPRASKVLLTATSPDIAATLALVEDVEGYHLASFRLDTGNLIASVQLTPLSAIPGNAPRAAFIDTGGDQFAALLSGKLYTGSLKNLRGDNSLPFHILPQQSTFVLAADEPTTVRYEAAGATRFRISSQILGSADKPFEATSETGEFTLSVSEALDKLSNNTIRPAFYSGPLQSAFRRLFGREPNGIPLPIDIEVTAYGTEFESAILRHDFLVEVPLQLFEGPSPWKKPPKEFDLTNYPATASPPSGVEPLFDYSRKLWATEALELTGAALRDAAQQAKAAGDKRMHDRYVSWTANKQWRTWTDADGRQTEALLVQVFAGQVTLRTRRGVEFTFDETKLSEGDREFLQNTPEPVTPNDSDLWREFVVAEAARTVPLFHNAHKVYPPRALTDDTGQPRLSWRVLMLSELGYGELFALFHFDEPWNSDHNRELIPFIPNALTLDAQLAETGKTTLMTVSSPLSAMPTSGVANVRNIASEADSTIVFVEAVASRATEWTKPLDLQLYEFAAPESVVRARDTKILVGLLSGTAIRIPADTSPDDWRFAIDLGDGRKVFEPSMP